MEEEGKAAGPPDESRLRRRVRVTTGTQHYRTEVEAGNHTMVVDEPFALGGADLGPTPFDLLCVSLASCTTITLRMYADRKEWPLEKVTASVAYQRAGKGSEEQGSFEVDLELHGSLDEAQRARLLEIAERCPVHRTLAGGAAIVSRLV